MAKQDIETIRDKIVQIVKDNLSAQITCINAEKADSIVLADIPTDKYFAVTNEEIWNFPVFIYHPFQTFNSTGKVGSATAVTVELGMEVCLVADINGNPNDDERRVLRYTRALQEVIQNNFGELRGITSNLEVSPFEPISPVSNDGMQWMIAGILITFTTAL